jgi:DNA gyrase subunit A
MRLQRLVALEKDEILLESEKLQREINELSNILENKSQQINILISQLRTFQKEYGFDRKTTILQESLEEVPEISLIPKEEMVITLSKNDYVKRCPLDTYRLQAKGGLGIKALSFTDNDSLKQTLVASTHDKILFFSNLGKCYSLLGYEIPSFSREARGLPLINVLPSLTNGEKISVIVSISKFLSHHYLLFITKKGIVKKTSLTHYQQINKNGKIAINLRKDDELITVLLATEEDADLFLATASGYAICFSIDQLRVLPRNAMGVKGINPRNSVVVSACIRTIESHVLTISEKGIGKLTTVINKMNDSEASERN